MQNFHFPIVDLPISASENVKSEATAGPSATSSVVEEGKETTLLSFEGISKKESLSNDRNWQLYQNNLVEHILVKAVNSKKNKK